MPTLEQRIARLEAQIQRSQATTQALQGLPSDATLSIPHNDSWLFEDNVDGAGGFPGNLRYVISSNVQRVVSAKLSIHLAAYRTYNSLSFANTGAGTAHHHTHGHTITLSGNLLATFVGIDGGGAWSGQTGGGVGVGGTTPADNNDSTNESAHTHPVPGSNVLGVTEGVVAAGVSISFDGVDRTPALGGPFNADVIEVSVLQFLPLTKGVFHTIAMLPTGLGRIEAHLRLGVYVAAGSEF